MKKTQALLASCALALSFAGAAQAQPQFEKPQDAIAYRQAALKLMGAHSGALAQVMRGRAPYDADQVRSEVEVLRGLAALPWKGFIEGSEGGGARPEIWKEPEKFMQAARTLHENLDKLAAAADTGEFDKVRAAYADTASSCKACHDSFRQRR